MKILITGATGYIGQKLTEKLSSEKHEIHVLARHIVKAKELLPFPNIYSHEGDILNVASNNRLSTGHRTINFLKF